MYSISRLDQVFFDQRDGNAKMKIQLMDPHNYFLKF